MWLQSFRSTFLEAVLQLLWRQWTSLGILGQSGYAGSSPIDPEALIFSTMQFGRYDPRLFDAVIEWWLENGEWLSSTRLQKFQKELASVERRALAASAETVILQKKSGKWKKFAMQYDAHAESMNPDSLFLLRDGKPLPRIGTPDPTFLRFGLTRPKFAARQISKRVPLARLWNFRIRQRAFFGVGSRAEIALYLLTHQAAHPRKVARQTHYAFASVSTALQQMELSGLVSRQRLGREVEYAIDHVRWRRFFELPRKASWTNWKVIFDALRDIWRCLEDMKERRPSESILGSEMWRCARRVNRLLRESEIDKSFSEDAGEDFRKYLDTFLADCRKLFLALDRGLGNVLTPQ